ncbi:hypothetical protein C2869_16450 [Saccharobesus litoralis]|uniref:Lipoprotein n=1 Tax=Saccharobesus litoralis TaxID=2172099 RepID=A0A2S0VUP1_9ALTE|nr:hypothetical protein [Saccharobesus litoralis]AWB67915.1 hypothetical protein C2869_16450 [Saccharobesus litoralis]
MEIKNLFKVSALAAAMTLVGCGGDINITPTVNNNGNGDVATGDKDSTTNPCASYGSKQGTFDGLDCLYNASFASKNISITENLTFEELAGGGVHSFAGALLFGADGNTTQGFTIPTDGPTMTVKPGATLAFQSGEAIIRIARGAKIEAIGTFDKPITFTSANAFPRLDVVGDGPQFADWGGIIINGNGVTDQCTDQERDHVPHTCNAESEAVTSYYGGTDNTDSSGNIKYAKIWYAGSGPKTGGAGDDLNSLTLNAVGSGSLFDFIHIHQGYDDGIEFFGGAANIKHIAVTDTQDDAIDVDAGWQGNGQFIFVKHGTVKTVKETVILQEADKSAKGEDTNGDGKIDDKDDKVPLTLAKGTPLFMGNNGFETDGIKGSTSAQAPRSNPTFANVTVITTDGKSVRDVSSSQAYKFDDYIRSQYYNVLMVKADGTNGTDCIEFKGDGAKPHSTDVDADAAALGAPEADKLNFTTSVMACVNEFKSSDALPGGEAKTDWFSNGGSNESVGGNADVLANAFATKTASTDITITATDPSTINTFFEAATYIGAVSDQDTSSEWYKWVEMAVNAAEQD